MYETSLLSPHVIEVTIPYNKDTRNFSFLLSADHHWDNPKCNRKLLKRHHEQAKERNAGIFCFGDLFCVMQGKADRRGSKADVRDEHKGTNYFDKVVKTAAQWYSPYKDNYIMMSPGNHETAILKYQETDLIERLTDRLGVPAMKYSGYVIFKFVHTGGGAVRKIVLFYHHGHGGGGPVTKGVIQTNRRAVYIPDADIVCTGHIHERWTVEVPRERLQLKSGKTYIRSQTHVSVSTYKEEYLAHQGYHPEQGRPPKPIGGYWLHFDVDTRQQRFSFQETDGIE